MTFCFWKRHARKPCAARVLTLMTLMTFFWELDLETKKQKMELPASRQLELSDPARQIEGWRKRH
jgi:hypothetical protein